MATATTTTTIHSCDNGNKYDISYQGTTTTHLVFQKGDPKQVGKNGLYTEDLLAILIDRLTKQDKQKPSCHNAVTLGHLKAALASQNLRMATESTPITDEVTNGTESVAI